MCLTHRNSSESLTRWNAHATRLSRLGEQLANITSAAPCVCGGPKHCKRLACLEVELKSAHSEVVAACMTANERKPPAPRQHKAAAKATVPSRQTVAAL
jgi:hypothetical protein